jgi:DHA1 family multidrug resistance protein-like MFS transporter
MTATRIGSVVPRREQRVVAYLLGALLVETLFFVVLSPLLPVYARQLHLSRLAAGVMSASYSIGYGLAAVPAGAIVGRLGQRRTSIGGLALVGLSCATFAVARDTIALDAARTITGAGAAAVWAGSIPWLVSLGGEGDRGHLIGLAFSAASAGACVGPAVGALATVIGPRDAFLCLSVLIFGLVVAGTLASSGHEPPRAVLAKRSLRMALRAPGASQALAIVALPSLGFGVAGVLLPLRLRGLGVAEVVIAADFLAASVLEVIANPLVGRWFDRSGGARVLQATLIGSAACVIAIALPLPATVLLIALTLSFPVLGSVWVPSLAQLAASVEGGATHPGVALGLFNITWAICQVTGAVVGAQLSRFGQGVPFLVLALLYALGTRAAASLPSTPDPARAIEPQTR